MSTSVSKMTLIATVLLIGMVGASVTAVYYAGETARLQNQIDDLKKAAQGGLDLDEIWAKKMPEGTEAASTDDRHGAEGDDSDAAAYLRRIGELEAVLGEKDAMIASLRSASGEESRERRREDSESSSSSTNRPTERQSRTEWMAELKKTDPERYEEIAVAREKSFTDTETALAARAAFFKERDTSSMDEEQKKRHDRTVELIGSTWQVYLQLQVDEEMSRDDRWALHGQMRENMHELDPLLKEAREQEFEALGAQLGYEGNEAEQFATQVKDVIELTSVGGIFRAMSGGRMRGPGRGRGR